MDFGYREKEKAVVLLAGEIIFQCSIVLRLVSYLEFNNLFILQKRICDIVLFLQVV